MSGKGRAGLGDPAGSGGLERSDRADRDRDYGDSAGYGGGGAALDYDEVLGETGRGRNLEHNPLDEVIPDPGGPSDDEVRARAYARWEEAGRPNGREEEFWQKARRELGGWAPGPGQSIQL